MFRVLREGLEGSLTGSLTEQMDGKPCMWLELRNCLISAWSLLRQTGRASCPKMPDNIITDISAPNSSKNGVFLKFKELLKTGREMLRLHWEQLRKAVGGPAQLCPKFHGVNGRSRRRVLQAHKTSIWTESCWKKATCHTKNAKVIMRHEKPPYFAKAVGKGCRSLWQSFTPLKNGLGRPPPPFGPSVPII